MIRIYFEQVAAFQQEQRQQQKQEQQVQYLCRYKNNYNDMDEYSSRKSNIEKVNGEMSDCGFGVRKPPKKIDLKAGIKPKKLKFTEKIHTWLSPSLYDYKVYANLEKNGLLSPPLSIRTQILEKEHCEDEDKNEDEDEEEFKKEKMINMNYHHTPCQNRLITRNESPVEMRFALSLSMSNSTECGISEGVMSNVDVYSGSLVKKKVENSVMEFDLDAKLTPEYHHIMDQKHLLHPKIYSS